MPHAMRAASDTALKLVRARAAGFSIAALFRGNAGRHRTPASKLVFRGSHPLQALPQQRSISERPACLHRPAVTR
jgi:hypothetical protein